MAEPVTPSALLALANLDTFAARDFRLPWILVAHDNCAPLERTQVSIYVCLGIRIILGNESDVLLTLPGIPSNKHLTFLSRVFSGPSDPRVKSCCFCVLIAQ